MSTKTPDDAANAISEQIDNLLNDYLILEKRLKGLLKNNEYGEETNLIDEKTKEMSAIYEALCEGLSWLYMSDVAVNKLYELISSGHTGASIVATRAFVALSERREKNK